MHWGTYCTFVNRTLDTPLWFIGDGIPTRSLDVFSSRMVGVTLSGQAYARMWSNGTSSEIPVGDAPSGLRAIATDGTFTCVIKNATEAVVCQQLPQLSWNLLGVRFSQIAIRAGRLYGVASNGTLWTTKLTASPEGSVDLAAFSKDEVAAEGR
ncbi:hypothetical protein PINS_up015767 [Pythium insidiosum]|nr:hypothetical protein PINS_up015767 [Pythium insidiosum]